MRSVAMIFSCVMIALLPANAPGLGLDGMEDAGPLNIVLCPPGTFKSRGSTIKQREACLPCPHGSFSSEWSADKMGEACQPCQGGSYGAMRGLAVSTCSGRCEPGYFCPPGSKSAREKHCGGNEWFCPTSSAERISVTPGYYSVAFSDIVTSGSISDSKSSDFDSASNSGKLTRAAQVMCKPGHYCELGVKMPCPKGTYNSEFGSTSIDDCVATSPGFYAREASAKQTACPPGTYTAESNTSECSALCEEGHYCEANSVSGTHAACAAGLAGGSRGLPSAACSALCDKTSGYCVLSASSCPEGSYCPLATSTPLPCGGPDMYCPAGSPTPVSVDVGYFSIGGTSEEMRTAQQICPEGHYCIDGIKRQCPMGRAGVTKGLSVYECTAPCEAGFFCGIGSSSRRQNRCGSPDRYCPAGASKTYTVDPGHYLVGGDATTRIAQEMCPLGHACERGIKIACAAGSYGPEKGLSACLTCPQSHYCLKMSVRPAKCPAGTFSAKEGHRDAGCSGPCKAGFFCLEAATSNEQYQCGADAAVPQKDAAPRDGAYGAESGEYYGDAHGVAGSRPRDIVYCPAGSGTAQNVTPGFFAAGGTAGARTHQLECDQSKRQWDANACVSPMSF